MKCIAVLSIAISFKSIHQTACASKYFNLYSPLADHIIIVLYYENSILAHYLCFLPLFSQSHGHRRAMWDQGKKYDILSMSATTIVHIKTIGGRVYLYVQCHHIDYSALATLKLSADS